KLIVRIGYAANDRVSWSSSGFMLDEAKPASRDIAGLTVVCSVPMDVTLDDCTNSHGPDILESLGSKAFSLDPPPGEIEQIPRDGFIRLTIATESSLISLLVRRMIPTEPLGPDSYPMGDILLIESLVSVRCVSSCLIRITPILFPVCDHPEEVVTQVSISKLLHDSVPFCKPMKTSPLPRWFLSHPGLYNATGFGLSGCLLLSSESGETPLVPVLLHSFLSIFTMDCSNYGNSHPETCPRVQLVSFPSDERPDPVPKLIVLTHAPASTGKVIIDFIDFAYDPSVLPTALRIVNKTDRADLCVNLCDPHWSVLDKKQHDSWHRALSDTRWTLNAHNGALVWIPESTVRDMYISDDSFSISTDAGVSPFLSPSSLGDVVLSVGCRSADGRSTVTGVDLGTLFASGSGLAIGLPDSTSIHLFGLWDPQLGTTVLIYSEPQHLTLNDEVSVTPLATYSLTCGQFSVSLLTCKPLWPLETRYGAPTNLCSTFTPQPPKDECVRLVMRGLRIDSYMATSPTPLCDVNIRLRHLQLDNWAQKWTHAYDFPVLLRSNTPAVLCIRIQSPHFSLQPVVFSAFLYPPQLDLYIEDTAVHEFSDLLLDYYHTLSRARTANLPGDRLIVHSQPLYLKCLHIASCTVLLTVRATLRVYLSCHEAPVTLAAFSLRSIDGGRHGSGYALKLVSLRRLLTMHYVSEVIFRAGWLVGSLDMLGNVTGLLHSLTDGLRDLVHMRRSQARNHLPDLVPVDPSTADTSKAAVSLITNTTNSSEYVVVMGDVSKNSLNPSTPTDVGLIPTQDTAPFCRIFHGLTSLNRHATG
ncbi:unnamed protein product, partial [Dicrocoelium dendriticum]